MLDILPAEVNRSPVSDAASPEPGSGSPFADLRAAVDADLAKVNALILERMRSPVGLIPELAGHIVASGGKRLRPMLTLAAARLCGYTGDRHIGLAASVEFIHTATLLHDDVVDGSALRRGLATANAVWGNQASVLVGDFLFSQSFRLMVGAGSLPILDVLANAAAAIAEGEVRQLTTANRPGTDEADYLKVVEGKTAVLFAAASQVGAMVAGRPDPEADALRGYGMHLGIAFQLIDDMLDYSAREADLGKTPGDDFAEGKATLPVILAYRCGDAGERAFWERTVGRLEQNEGDFDRAVGLMRRHGVLDETRARAGEQVARARQALSAFPEGRMRAILIGVADFCVERAF